MTQSTDVSGEYSQGLRWLCLFATSGVDIPSHIFEGFASTVSSQNSDLKDCNLLLKAILVHTWLRPLGRYDLQQVIALLNRKKESEIVRRLQCNDGMAEVWVEKQILCHGEMH